jgi:hypothetical protein
MFFRQSSNFCVRLAACFLVVLAFGGDRASLQAQEKNRRPPILFARTGEAGIETRHSTKAINFMAIRAAKRQR